MMKTASVLVAFLALGAFCSLAIASDDYPSTGIVFNTKEDSSIRYDCIKRQNGILECDFVQTSVRKKSKSGDLSGKIEQAKKQLKDAIKEISSDKSCESMDLFLKVLRGEISPEMAAERAAEGQISDKSQFVKGMKEAKLSKRQDLIQDLGAFAEFCKTKSQESYLKITRQQHDKDVRTCNVSSFQFKQNFKWVGDYSGYGAWVVEATPEGPCGVVQLSRFEADRTSSKFVFWRYVAKKAVTNPNGESNLPGFLCRDFDEDEYLYDWKNERDSKLGCDYVIFSPM
jgi:hypothetical protein